MDSSRRADGAFPAAGSEATPFNITHFPDKRGRKLRLLSTSWSEFVDRLRRIPPRPKKDGGLVKLAVFGDKRTETGCLRHDANVIEVTGIEGDYDAGEVAPEDALKRLETYGIRAVVVTTHSHEPAAPRWRVFAPLSQPAPPEERRQHVARLNGALEGILGAESFALSQSYFLGSRPGGEYKVLPTFEDPEKGSPIDLLEQLDQIAVSAGSGATGGTVEGEEGGSTQEWLPALLAGENVHENALKLVGRWVSEGWDDQQIKLFMGNLAPAVRTERGPDRAKALVGAELDRMIQGARAKGFRRPTLSDTGNATRLIELHGERLHYIPKWGKWIVCGDDGFWEVDHQDVQVQELAKDVGRTLKMEAQAQTDKQKKRMLTFAQKSLNVHGIKAMITLARGIEGIALEHEKLDADGWLLGVEDGVIDLRSGERRAAEPTDLMTRRSPVKWDADATAPRFERAMEEWFPDPELRAYVQRVAGAALVGEQRDHAFIIHYGNGRNGKGTFMRAIQRVLGPHARVIHLSLLVETKYSQHDTVKADLFRTRLAIASETQKGGKLDEASVKNLTGGDRITARRMREDAWEFDPTHSLWLLTNHLPEIGGRDTGIWSRIRVVRWPNTFVEHAQDTNLDATLAEEASGILRWLVEGALEWQKHGLSEPQAVVDETLAYRSAQDKLSRFKEDTGLKFAPELEIEAGELRQRVGEWAREEGITTPTRELSEWLKENGAHQVRKRLKDAWGAPRQRRVWKGVGMDIEQRDAGEDPLHLAG